MKNISFLHFTDIHLGLDAQTTLISKFKDDLFNDIRKVHSYMGNWDLVFFTGDFVQSGKKEEFNKATEFLSEMWSVFNELGCRPLFIGVPGNHDLEWINNPYDSKLQYLLGWGNDENFSEKYFWKNENEYKKFIEDRFINYKNWYESLNVPKPTKQIKGYLPGDFACIMNINDVKIGCICLNSAFLQLNEGDFKNKIDINSNQITSLLNEEYVSWVKGVDIALLLTHHSSDWLSPIAKRNFEKEIYFPDSFVLHLCGHMHEAELKQSGGLISSSRKTQIAPSLFGLEKNNEGWERIHGYYAGKFEISDNRINEHLYPRIMVESRDGSNRIAADNRFNLLDEKYTCFSVRDFESQIAEKEEKPLSHTNDNLFNKSNIDNLSRTHYSFSDAHKQIREVERTMAIEKLEKERILWISTKWGLEEDCFIGTLIPYFKINPNNCFSIDCSDIKNIDDFYKSFDNTFHISFNNFAAIVSQLENPLLVLNRVNSDILNPVFFLDKIQPLIDFATKLRIIIISEAVPKNIECIELLPLDIPSVKLYASAYNISDLNLNNQLLLEKLHRITSGLPIYLDKRLEELKYCSLSDILEDEYDSNDIIVDDRNNALHRLIDDLKNSDEDRNRRAFDLLKVLCILKNGEIFSRIRRFNPTSPFYPNHITILENYSLIEVVTMNTISFSGVSDAFKLLKARRPVRDYINQIVDDEEKVELYKSVCELYFGRNWRTAFKLSSIKSPALEMNNIVYGNSYGAIRYLLLDSLKSNKNDIKRFVNISIIFCESLSDTDIFKDSAYYAEEIYNILEKTDLNEEKVYIGKVYGKTLRMNDQLEDKSIDILTKVLSNDDNFLSSADKANVNLNIAYYYNDKEDGDLAIKYANEVKKYAKKDGSMYIGAESVIASFMDSKEKQLAKLRALLSKAKKYNYITSQENLQIQISSIVDDRKEEIERLDRVLKSDTNGVFNYNKVRAIVHKCETYNIQDEICNLSGDDLGQLYIAYTYLFYQNFLDLFDRCHKAIWNYFSHYKNYTELLNLFRYSSFIWRIVGKEEKEKLYIDKLIDDSEFDITKIKVTSTVDEMNKSYYCQRMQYLSNKCGLA